MIEPLSVHRSPTSKFLHSPNISYKKSRLLNVHIPTDRIARKHRAQILNIHRARQDVIIPTDLRWQRRHQQSLNDKPSLFIWGDMMNAAVTRNVQPKVMTSPVFNGIGLSPCFLI